VLVREGDDEASLHARIQVEEHRLYPQVIKWYAAGKLEIVGRKIIVKE